MFVIPIYNKLLIKNQVLYVGLVALFSNLKTYRVDKLFPVEVLMNKSLLYSLISEISVSRPKTPSRFDTF